MEDFLYFSGLPLFPRLPTSKQLYHLHLYLAEGQKMNLGNSNLNFKRDIKKTERMHGEIRDLKFMLNDHF